MRKNLFILVDCSGSTVRKDNTIVQCYDNILRRIVNNGSIEPSTSIQVIVYNDNARKLATYVKGDEFASIPKETFAGRSSLGSAYSLVEDLIKARHIVLNDCVMALLTDGGATDDYAACLHKLDPDGKIIRIAFCAGDDGNVCKTHATSSEHIFNGLISSGDFTADVFASLAEVDDGGVEHIGFDDFDI